LCHESTNIIEHYREKNTSWGKGMDYFFTEDEGCLMNGWRRSLRADALRWEEGLHFCPQEESNNTHLWALSSVTVLGGNYK
jgi:hypothetical protein